MIPTKQAAAFILMAAAGHMHAAELPAATINGTEAGWTPLLKADFTAVNSADDTWAFDDGNNTISCTGKPVSVIRSTKPYTNFELVVEWMHEKPSGNSGVFVWTSKAALDALTKPGLPDEGIEVQILDLAFKESYEKSSGKPSNWFTCNGDVFPVKKAKMTPFPPLSPDGVRSFPSAETTKPHGEWNHYYIRAINGEIRLWVNGTEVSGGKDCSPSTGYLCLESEGSPIKFRNLKIRELP
jgi:hypothetical protein